MRKTSGFAALALIAFFAIGAAARTSTPIDGRPWFDSDDACFASDNHGIIYNTCTTKKTFRIGGHVDSSGTKTVNMHGRGNGGTADPTTCTIISTNSNGVIVGSALVSTTSSTMTQLAPFDLTVFVPANGQLYAHCELAPQIARTSGTWSGGLASFRYTP